jgi:hypothetical protein
MKSVGNEGELSIPQGNGNRRAVLREVSMKIEDQP